MFITLKLRHIALTLCLAVGFSSQADAGLVNDVPSCYTASHYKFISAPYTRLIYVLIDQTVQLDPTLQQSVIDNINRAIGPGTKFVITEFSAFSQGRYLNVLHTGIVENPMTADERNNVPITSLRGFNDCMRGQAQFSLRMADQTASQVIKSSTSSLDQSDIMQALKTVSAAIRQDPAKDKIVFVATDGLENSSATSFYASGTVRDINPQAEFAKAKSNDMLGNFGGAKVYVLGGAIMPPATQGTRAMKDGYRDPKTLHELKTFWDDYFKASNADLVEFGEPGLVKPVSY